ncbi:helix-turn-helix domain-containing protein [Variovorax sp. RCC_210]|uniref:helix-turn-helix domain-containing protein n=1 Tax=Variovorax sp. RCC_210 TaxID=3239217 RepID=UPI0035246418
MSMTAEIECETRTGTLMRSSTALGCESPVRAEIYKYTHLDRQAFVQPATEVVINIGGSANFRRRADGPEQKFLSRLGCASICPSGVAVRYLHIDSGPLDMLHLQMPTDMFGTLRCSGEGAANAGLMYAGGVHDPLIESIGFAIAQMLVKDSADARMSRLYLDSYGVALAARLLQQYTHGNSTAFAEPYFDAQSGRGLDRTRLHRVIEFIQENLESDLCLDDLAEVACLSVFHFCRAFKVATGHSPFQYISDARIKKVKLMLANPSTTINEIAFSTGFSSAANLARAFRKSVGTSPTDYRNSLTV